MRATKLEAAKDKERQISEKHDASGSAADFDMVRKRERLQPNSNLSKLWAPLAPAFVTRDASFSGVGANELGTLETRMGQPLKMAV